MNHKNPGCLIPCRFLPVCPQTYSSKPDSSYQAVVNTQGRTTLKGHRAIFHKHLNLIKKPRKIRTVDTCAYFVVPHLHDCGFVFILSRGESGAAYHLGVLED